VNIRVPGFLPGVCFCSFCKKIIECRAENTGDMPRLNSFSFVYILCIFYYILIDLGKATTILPQKGVKLVNLQIYKCLPAFDTMSQNALRNGSTPKIIKFNKITKLHYMFCFFMDDTHQTLHNNTKNTDICVRK